MSWFKFIQNFPIGAFFGALIGGLFILFVGPDLGDELSRYGTYGLTLLTTLLASGIALTTAIWNTETIRHRKLVAAKSTLPLALSRLHSIGVRGAELALKRSLGELNSDDTIQAERLIAELEAPVEIIAILKDAIEHSSECDGEHLSSLIKTYQVLFARTESFLRELNDIILIDRNEAINWAVFVRMVGNCFEFARLSEPNISDSLDELNLSGFFRVALGVSQLELDGLQPLIDATEAREDPRPVV